LFCQCDPPITLDIFEMASSKHARETFYFVLENHVLPRIAGSSMGVVRDNGSAGHFSLARSDGVLDDWSIGKTLTGYSVRKAQDRQVLCNVPDFQNPSLNSRPLLQYSLAQTWLARIGFRAKDAIIFAKQYHVTMSSHQGRPLLQQPRDLIAGFWPPSRGLQTKPCPPPHSGIFDGRGFFTLC